MVLNKPIIILHTEELSALINSENTVAKFPGIKFLIVVHSMTRGLLNIPVFSTNIDSARSVIMENKNHAVLFHLSPHRQGG
jgi:hypothetical protein